MGSSSLYLFMFMRLLFLLQTFHIVTVTKSYSSAKPLCHSDERAALIQFNHSLSLRKFASSDPFAYPKVTSWKLERGSDDCCTWEGVECDEYTGHVIGLELGSSFLYGSIDSNSSLFDLAHLQTLNLADNDFNYSRIPSGIARLSMLSTLNLSNSVFYGQIPSEISKLYKLVSLDLSFNFDDDVNLLKLEKPDLRSLVQNLTNLKELHLSMVDISSQVPENLSNLTSLRSLALSSCQFSGYLPASLNNLTLLTSLDLSINQFGGPIPILDSLTQLSLLSLSRNNFGGADLFWLGKLTQLTTLDLAEAMSDEIPSSLANLTQLAHIDLNDNQLAGKIPSWLTNMTQLISINFCGNQLQGQIPSSFSQLKNLFSLCLSFNNLTGTVEADIFLSLTKLEELQLGGNHITLLTDNRTNETLPRFSVLSLDSCNLSEFPHFLRFQDELEVLSLSENQIRGKIPEWLLNMSKGTLGAIDLSYNMLEGFDQLPEVLPWAILGIINLGHNMLRGPLPVPSPKIFDYRVSFNSLTGEIPSSFCSMRHVSMLDLSNNNIHGTIPPCLGNLGSLSVLSLNGNKFSGHILQTYEEGNNLKMLDLSQNRLEGQVPRSLANCANLVILDLSDNQIEDIFPFWLGTLPRLSVLVLRSNKFHGAIQGPKRNEDFSELRIIDLSNNGFTSYLPLGYFKIWNKMKIIHEDQVAYLGANITFSVLQTGWTSSYPYTVTITNKAVKTNYVKILNVFTVIDLSSNKFKGEIPPSIGNLKGLQSLNLSNNDLVGPIPPSLGQLSQLESLDLSHNKLSGKIPTQLVLLNFLAVLNVSFNNISGPVPKGKQFDTFQNDSYMGNSALCGEPLSRRCGDLGTTPPLTIEQADDSEFPSTIDWIVRCLGLGSGLVVGLISGWILTTRNHEWFVEKFGKRKASGRTQRKRGQRS